jgi:hypothetical protein
MRTINPSNNLNKTKVLKNIKDKLLQISSVTGTSLVCTKLIRKKRRYYARFVYHK